MRMMRMFKSKLKYKCKNRYKYKYKYTFLPGNRQLQRWGCWGWGAMFQWQWWHSAQLSTMRGFPDIYVMLDNCSKKLKSFERIRIEFVDHGESEHKHLGSRKWKWSPQQEQNKSRLKGRTVLPQEHQVPKQYLVTIIELSSCLRFENLDHLKCLVSMCRSHPMIPHHHSIRLCLYLLSSFESTVPMPEKP